MTRLILFMLMLVCSLQGYAQADTRPVVGVAAFTCDQESPYTGLVTEKVVEMLTGTRRFRVVDRTSRDKINEELELQKSESFIDSKNLVEQDVAVAAEKMITGHIVKIPVYRIKNGDGSTRGYKASVAFQMKVVDVATGLSTEATSFQGKTGHECLSPESAVTEAMMSLQTDIYDYFRLNFPVTARISRILAEKNGVAKTLLVSAGKAQGISVGCKFTVESIETIDGLPYPVPIGTIEVKRIAGDIFSECEADKKTGTAIADKFRGGSEMICKLIINK
ncbi:MAG: penicillin-binding protein activator LpoB [Prevotella sp.]|nr:penicillin-binding protein activator LpoB [Prevotella sp.]